MIIDIRELMEPVAVKKIYPKPEEAQLSKEVAESLA